MEKCIFCGEQNNGSDEHIIPDCVNGRLHSKDLICHDCNSKKFGAKIDPIIKDLFGPLMTIWGFKNGKSFNVQTPDGTEYLLSKDRSTKQVKPTLDIINKDGKTEIIISGDPKNSIRLFEKRQKEFIEKGYKQISISQKEGATFQPPLSTKLNFESSTELKLLLNKIAVEFYAFSGLPIELLSELTASLNLLDETIDNVIFCNFNQEIRKFEDQETSHIITIKNDTETKTLFAYVELFNVVCAIIPLVKDYNGENVNISYKQDAISGERTESNITLNEATTALLKDNDSISADNPFNVLINLFSQRLKEKEFSKTFEAELAKIKVQLNAEISDGSVTKEAFAEEFTKRSTRMVAELSVFEYPYLIDKFKDEENEDLNYIHSNLKETEYNEFCEKYLFLLGKELAIKEEGNFIVEGFYKQPFMEKNGIILITVYFVLREKRTGKKLYIPYNTFFEGISIKEKNS